MSENDVRFSNSLLKAYTEYVNETFKRLFAQHKISESTFQAALADALHGSFAIQDLRFKSLNDLARAKVIIQSLFACFPPTAQLAQAFPLTTFLQEFIPQVNEQSQFLSALLYGLYYGDVDLAQHLIQNQTARFDFFLFQVLAETVSEKTLHCALGKLFFDTKLFLICYAALHYREGSFYIFNAFLKKASLKPASSDSIKFAELIKLLKSNYFSVSKLQALLLEIGEETIDANTLTTLLTALHKSAQSEVSTVHMLLQNVIEAMIESPVAVCDLAEKYRLNEKNTSHEFQSRLKAEAERENLRNYFSPYLSRVYPKEMFRAFFAVFGLQNHLPPLIVKDKERKERTLVDKLTYLYNLFSYPLSLINMPRQDILNMFAFVFNVVNHLEIFCFFPEKLSQGFDLLSCAIPTKGKNLAKQAGLISFLQAALDFIAHFNASFAHLPHNPLAKMSMRQLPIFIFDQSEGEVFAKNKEFIALLNSQSKCFILHLSTAEILSLAQKTGVAALLKAPHMSELGFGGARNAVFLLTPVLYRAFKAGKRSFAEILQLPDSFLRGLFKQFTLGKENANASTQPGKSNTCGDTLLMLDDDMEISSANFFSHVIYAQAFQNSYAYSCGFGYGRGTKYYLHFHPLQSVLHHPSEIFKSTRWLQNTSPALYSEYVGKPKICLNTPLGAEEAHLKIDQKVSFFLSPSYHLAGTRYPLTAVPTDFYVGLDEYLKNYLPYTLGIELVFFLIDPLNCAGQCALPWKDKHIAGSFANLLGVFEFISTFDHKLEMQKRFWKNVGLLSSVSNAKADLALLRTLRYLSRLDVDAIIQDFQKNRNVDHVASQSLANISMLYKRLRQDALMLMEFVDHMLILLKMNEAAQLPQTTCLKEFLEMAKVHVEKRFDKEIFELPLTKGFWLLAHSIGLGEFCEAIKEALK